MGHEGTGTIVAVGAGVSSERIGDRVVIEPNYPCGACDGCRCRTAMCQNRRSVGINIPGLLRERAAIPAQFAWNAPEGLADQDLMCVEPMAVALHAARLGNAAAAGTSCLIVGAGSQGLLLLMVLRAMGAEVTVVEPRDGRLAIARSLGARIAERDSYELVFETSGSVGGTQRALRSLGTGGTLVLIGIPHDDVPLSTASIVRGHATVMGSIIYDHPHDFSDTLAFITAHALSPSSIIRRTFGFADSQAALSSAVDVAGKSWIKF